MDVYNTPKERNENYIEYLSDEQEFYLIKENNVFKFIIGKRINEIFIQSKKYGIKFKLNELSIITQSFFNAIDDGYKFIINLFEENKVNIKDIIFKKTLLLILKIYIHNKEKEIEIPLSYNTQNKDKDINALIINYNELKNDVKNLKEETKLLKKEINELKYNNYILTHSNEKHNNLKNSNLSYNIDNYSNPENIQFYQYLTKDSYTGYLYDNAFSVFKSIYNIFYLIFGNKNKSIICLNLINNQIINDIKNAHKYIITNFRHFLDKINNRDLLLSISNDYYNGNELKLWNINNWECLLNIENIYKKGKITSASFLSINNENYIITCNYVNKNTEPLKIIDFKGNKIKIINDSNENTYFIDIFYDRQLFKNFIITGNGGYIKSYDYNNNIIYRKYLDKDKDQGICFSFIIKIEKNIIKIISSYDNGNIRIWNFHNGNLLNKIKIGGKLYGICLWNDEYLFIGSKNHSIKLININEEKVIKELNNHYQEVCTIKKIFHPKYGECLISHGLDTIVLWKNIK